MAPPTYPRNGFGNIIRECRYIIFSSNNIRVSYVKRQAINVAHML